MLGRKAIGSVAYLGGLPAVLEQFTWSWSQMVAYNGEFIDNDKQYIHYMRSTISDHAPARNTLVSKFLGDWLIQFDTDHMFDPDIVARMIRTANEYEVDVLSAVYQLKNPPHVPVLYQWVNVGNKLGLQPMARWDKNAKLIQIGSAGGGCLFVRRKVFDILSKYSDGPFDKQYPYSEDHSFFKKCRECDIKCYAAMNIYCNHLRIIPVTLSDLDDSGLEISNPFQVRGF